MKRMPLLTAAGILLLAATITSCKSSRVWANKNKESKEERQEAREERREERQDNRYDDNRYEDYRPAPAVPAPSRSYASVPLVITPSPGFVMKQTPDGRYYHKTAQGLLYWKGSNNRFCLDKMYLSRVSYSNWEYDEWRRYNMGG